jgi:predicted nucleic acid-binding protein
VLLDTSVLGRVCHPRKHLDVRAWFVRALVDHEMLLSEIADFELRRELLRIDSKRSLQRLDELTREIQYVPMTTATWRAAAKLWAEQRRAGRPTGDGLDADLLIATQAREEAAAVVTLNEKHFTGIVDVFTWSTVPVSSP